MIFWVKLRRIFRERKGNLNIFSLGANTAHKRTVGFFGDRVRLFLLLTKPEQPQHSVFWFSQSVWNSKKGGPCWWLGGCNRPSNRLPILLDPCTCTGTVTWWWSWWNPPGRVGNFQVQVQWKHSIFWRGTKGYGIVARLGGSQEASSLASENPEVCRLSSLQKAKQAKQRANSKTNSSENDRPGRVRANRACTLCPASDKQFFRMSTVL